MPVPLSESKAAHFFRVEVFESGGQAWWYDYAERSSLYKVIYNTGDEVYLTPNGEVDMINTHDGIMVRGSKPWPL